MLLVLLQLGTKVKVSPIIDRHMLPPQSKRFINGNKAFKLEAALSGAE